MGPWPESLGIYKEPFLKMDPFSCTWQWMQHNLLVPDWLRLCPADQQALNKVPCIEIKSLLNAAFVGPGGRLLSLGFGKLNCQWVVLTCFRNLHHEFLYLPKAGLPRANGGGRIVEKPGRRTMVKKSQRAATSCHHFSIYHSSWFMILWQ